jgi:hypothetical protein
MGAKFDKALPGFNTNISHGGKTYHVQTEDSGKDRPHIITHVFLEGNIIATRKESYEQYLGRPDVDALIRDMMKKQQKEMAEMVSTGKFGGKGDFSVEVEVMPEARSASSGDRTPREVPSTPPPPSSKRTSGIYKKIYRREPTPIPFVPSTARRRRRTTGSKMQAEKPQKKVFIGGREVSSKETAIKEEKKDKQDKTLEEIIADYLSEKLVGE